MNLESGVEKIIEKICGNGEFLSYEIVPQKAFSIDSTLEKIAASALFERFDAFICTDSPLARLKHSAVLASIKIQNRLKKPTICTLSMRDKNSIALQGEILGLNEFDIRLFLALSGDPIRLGDQPQARGVFEGSSCVLLDIINALNSKKDLANQPLKDAGARIYGLCVVNAFANDPENIYKKMLKKIKNGALALVTQPIYDVENAKFLKAMIARANRELGTSCRLIFGFHPVLNLKTAEFLYHKLPGCYIPDFWLEELRGAGDEREAGLRLSRQLFSDLRGVCQKIHIMSGNSIAAAEEILL